MLPLLTIVGATGLQGGSVLASALKTKQYRIRAITSNTRSASALKLASQGVELDVADLDGEASLVKALEGSTAVFAMTNFFEYFPQVSAEEAVIIETKQAINLASAAAKTPTLKHYIWSTLPNIAKITKGKYDVPHTIGKNRADDFIKANEELRKKTTFLWCTFYAQNFMYPMMTPTYLRTIGKYVQLVPVPADTPMDKIGDVRKNFGIFASAIFAQPDKTWGKYVLALLETTIMNGFLQYWSEGTGKESLYVQLASVQEYENIFPMWGTLEGNALKFWEEYPDQSWVDVDGVEVLTKEELMIDEKEFVGVRETVEVQDWSEL